MVHIISQGTQLNVRLRRVLQKKTKRYDFPDKDVANKVWTHDLQKLLNLADLNIDLDKDVKHNKTLEINWAVIKDWSESIRYDQSISESQAKDFLSACSARNNGILNWIKKRW